MFVKMKCFCDGRVIVDYPTGLSEEDRENCENCYAADCEHYRTYIASIQFPNKESGHDTHGPLDF